MDNGEVIQEVLYHIVELYIQRGCWTANVSLCRNKPQDAGTRMRVVRGWKKEGGGGEKEKALCNMFNASFKISMSNIALTRGI